MKSPTLARPRPFSAIVMVLLLAGLASLSPSAEAQSAISVKYVVDSLGIAANGGSALDLERTVNGDLIACFPKDVDGAGAAGNRLAFGRSTNNGETWSTYEVVSLGSGNAGCGLSEAGGRYWLVDSTSNQPRYSTNNGLAWNLAGTQTFSAAGACTGTITQAKIAAFSATQWAVALGTSSNLCLYVTTNGGTSYTFSQAATSGANTYLDIKPGANANTYLAGGGNLLRITVDAGTSWTSVNSVTYFGVGFGNYGSIRWDGSNWYGVGVDTTGANGGQDLYVWNYNDAAVSAISVGPSGSSIAFARIAGQNIVSFYEAGTGTCGCVQYLIEEDLIPVNDVPDNTEHQLQVGTNGRVLAMYHETGGIKLLSSEVGLGGDGPTHVVSVPYLMGMDASPSGAQVAARQTLTGSDIGRNIRLYSGATLLPGAQVETNCGFGAGYRGMSLIDSNAGPNKNAQVVSYLQCEAGDGDDVTQLRIRKAASGSLANPSLPEACAEDCYFDIPDNLLDGDDDLHRQLSDIQAIPYDFSATNEGATVLSWAFSDYTGEIGVLALAQTHLEFEFVDFTESSRAVIDPSGLLGAPGICTTRYLEKGWELLYGYTNAANGDVRGFRIEFHPINLEPPTLNSVFPSGEVVGPYSVGCGDKYLLTVGDEEVRLWDVDTDANWQISTSNQATSLAAVDPKGMVAAYVDGPLIRLFDTATRTNFQNLTLPAYTGLPCNMELTNGGKVLYWAACGTAGGMDGTTGTIARYAVTDNPYANIVIDDGADDDSDDIPDYLDHNLDNDDRNNEDDPDVDGDGECNGLSGQYPALPSQPAGTPGAEDGCDGVDEGETPCVGINDPVGCAGDPDNDGDGNLNPTDPTPDGPGAGQIPIPGGSTDVSVTATSSSGSGGFGGDATTFIGVDLSGFSAVGLGVEAVRWFLGVLLIAGIAFGMGTLSPWLGLLGAVMGLALAIGFGLMPLWFVILIFMLAAGLVALMARR